MGGGGGGYTHFQQVAQPHTLNFTRCSQRSYTLNMLKTPVRDSLGFSRPVLEGSLAGPFRRILSRAKPSTLNPGVQGFGLSGFPGIRMESFRVGARALSLIILNLTPSAPTRSSKPQALKLAAYLKLSIQGPLKGAKP